MSHPPLRVYHGDDRPPAPRAAGIAQPTPDLRCQFPTEVDGQNYVVNVLLWRNEDAARCSWCPEGACNFTPGPYGSGVCRVVRRGDSAVIVPLASS